MRNYDYKIRLALLLLCVWQVGACSSRATGGEEPVKAPPVSPPPPHVTQRWRDWLAKGDTNGRQPIGDTEEPIQCGIKGCPVMVSRQMFNNAGKKETLVVTLDRPANIAPQIWAEHVRHSGPHAQHQHQHLHEGLSDPDEAFP